MARSSANKYSDGTYRPFVVDDGTGTAYVDPERADLVLTTGDEYTVEGGEEPPAFIARFLERETEVDPVGEYKRRYREFRLDVGEEVLVAGEADPDGDGETAATTAFVAAGSAPKFLVTDDTDLDVGSRMRQEAVIYFVIAGVLFAFSLLFFYMG